MAGAFQVASHPKVQAAFVQVMMAVGGAGLAPPQWSSRLIKTATTTHDARVNHTGGAG